MLFAEIRRLVADLVSQDYGKIVADGTGGRLSEVEIQIAIEQYGRTLIPLPDQAQRLIDVSVIRDDASKLSVDVPLWTKEEGRSDLTLSLIAERKQDFYDLKIQDLHVL